MFSNIVYANSYVNSETKTSSLNAQFIGNDVQVDTSSVKVIKFKTVEEMEAYMKLNNISEEDVFVTVPYTQGQGVARSAGYLRGTIKFTSKSNFTITFMNLGNGIITNLSYYGDVYDKDYNIRAAFSNHGNTLAYLGSISKSYSYPSINPILKVEVGYDFRVDGESFGGYGEKYNNYY